MSYFPTSRLRRLRKTPMIRALVQETELSLNDIIAPLFIVPGQKIKRPIDAMPDQFQLSIDEAIKAVDEFRQLGIHQVLLFGLPESKDDAGESACHDDGIIQQATKAIKQQFDDVLVMADLCFCEYTSHGHCGIIKDKDVDNDLTLAQTAKQTLSLAKAGVDVIAPSGMMDGVVSTIRQTLDEAGFTDLPIMGYSAKYASSYYGPFREAVDSTPSFGDRRTYQMNPANAREALREVALDIEEGADIVMVKPALAYLDIIHQVKVNSDLPVAAYNVSGEYSMIKHAAKAGLVDEDAMIYETLLSMKRAGADIIISYFGKDLARILSAR